MTRVVAIVRVLLRLGPVRGVVAMGVRGADILASLARRVAMLDPELARRSGVRSAHTPAPVCALALDPPVPAPQADLDELPSEATPSERRFLYSFFAHYWRGQANVVEVGPFIGGTTRAIALGMLVNPRRDPRARLYTYDRFDGYYEPDALAEYLAPLFRSGALSATEREAVERAGSFGEVFDAVHSGTPYAELIERRNRPLPDSPEEAQSNGELFEIDPGVRLDAVFVDGCKSWYGTKHFMRQVLEVTSPGGHFILQDYGWYTCFWIPAFVHAMGNAFAVTAWVDSTYAFHLVAPLDGGAVEASYPDTPEQLGRDWFEAAFVALRADAVRRGDRRGEIVFGLQHAAALAYLGERDEARDRIRRIRSKARISELRPVIDAALRSPTYGPDGEQILLEPEPG